MEIWQTKECCGLFGFFVSLSQLCSSTGIFWGDEKSSRGLKKIEEVKQGRQKKSGIIKEGEKYRKKGRERAPPAKSYWAVCRHTKATVSWHHNRKWCLAGASILLASVHTCTHTHTQTAISSRAWGTKQILPVRACIHFNSSLLVIRQ